jgi:hypothetical protein
MKSMFKSALGALTVALAVSGLLAGSALASGPPIVETKAASPIAGSYVTGNGIVNPNGTGSAGWHFEYGPTTAYGSRTSQGLVVGSTPKEVSKTIEELLTSTTYHYRIVATNANGTSYGADQEFTTTTEKPELVASSGKLLPLEWNASKFGTTTWAVSGKSFSCTGGESKGHATGSKTVQAKYVFTGCSAAGLACQTAGHAEHEIVTEELQGTLVYISKSAKTVGIVYKPLSGSTNSNPASKRERSPRTKVNSRSPNTKTRTAKKSMPRSKRTGPQRRSSPSAGELENSSTTPTSRSKFRRRLNRKQLDRRSTLEA